MQHSFVEARAGVKYHAHHVAENTIVQMDSCNANFADPDEGVRVGVFNFERSLRKFFDDRFSFSTIDFFVDAIVDWPLIKINN